MCDTERRCDRPSCPCNEPDTDPQDAKNALWNLQERFPAADGWSDHEVCDVGARGDNRGWCAIVLKSSGASHIGLDATGPTPHAAVDAAISAWDAAVKADALFKPLKAECEATRKVLSIGRVAIASRPTTGMLTMDRPADVDAVVASRAATDKAGALR